MGHAPPARRRIRQGIRIHDEYIDFVANDANQDLATAFAAELGGAKIVTDSTAA